MKVSIDKSLMESMLHIARVQHPYEVTLLLRGKVRNDEVLIEEFLFPPFASAGRNFAQFPSRMLPIDFSIVGTAHSHPTGVLKPSTVDLNNFYSRIMMILAYPYIMERAGVYNSNGERLPLIVLG